MRHIQVLSVTAALVASSAFACPDLSKVEHDKIKLKSTPMKQGKDLSLSLPNMHCGGCANKVKKLASKYPGLENPKVSIAGRSAIFTCSQDSCDAGQLIVDLQKSGYMLAK